MSRTDLTPTSYLVLGLVALHGQSTPYDLKRHASSIAYFWAFPHSQLYAEPARLAAGGLLEEEREEGGRRRRQYRITDAGRAAIADWLKVPSPDPPQHRDLGLLKLWFGLLVPKDDVVALARAQADAHRRRLALYEQSECDPVARPEEGHAAATLEMGKRFERESIAFWEELVSNPPVRPD